jgi:hypothetical protein
MRSWNPQGVRWINGLTMGTVLFYGVLTESLEFRNHEHRDSTQVERADSIRDEKPTLEDVLEEINDVFETREQIRDAAEPPELEQTTEKVVDQDRLIDLPELNEPELNEPDYSVDIGGPQVEKEIAEMAKLEKQQEQARAEQAEKVEKAREQMEQKYADSPDKEQQLAQFDKAADDAAKALADRQAAERQQLQEQQQLEQQRLHQEQQRLAQLQSQQLHLER